MLDGVNVSYYFITNATKDGRFGGNDTSINYAGSYALKQDSSIVYGGWVALWVCGG